MLRGLLLLWLVVGCEADDGFRLRVDLRTDYVPTAEFTAATFELLSNDGAPSSLIRHEAGTGDYATGVDVGVFSVPSGSYTLLARLQKADGAVVGQNSYRVLVNANSGVTAVVVRSCAGVSCGDGSQIGNCRGGECVDPSCTPETPDACEAECAADSECDVAANCAVGQCLDGVCLKVGDADPCAGGEFCNPDIGCMPVIGEPRDSGLVDSSLADTGVEDAGRADTGTDDAAIDDAAGQPCELMVSQEVGDSVDVIAPGRFTIRFERNARWLSTYWEDASRRGVDLGGFVNGSTTAGGDVFVSPILFNTGGRWYVEDDADATLMSTSLDEEACVFTLVSRLAWTLDSTETVAASVENRIAVSGLWTVEMTIENTGSVPLALDPAEYGYVTVAEAQMWTTSNTGDSDWQWRLNSGESPFPTLVKRKLGVNTDGSGTDSPEDNHYWQDTWMIAPSGSRTRTVELNFWPPTP